ncbi:caspase-7-like isoform X2 [Ornithodoros turicata]|uniref:caspase-7-like isoform X2 n=1 Tax=Ornithodoros turicata TaxID=34597 RepID=UPI0031392BFF
MEDKQSECHADEIPGGETGSRPESLPPVYADEGEVKLQDISIPEHYSHDDIWYKMDNLNAGKKCGICAIIKVKSPDTQEQSGAEADAKTIESVFGGVIGFDVKVYHASAPADIREKLKTCKDDIEKDSSRASDCFACFVLGHGKEDITFPFGGELIDLEYIYEQFSNKVCTKLLGKPKLFFLHTLRGWKQGGEHHFADGPSKTTSVPSRADFFTFESTSAGYLSSSGSVRGSLFVQALCQVIKRDYLTKNFQEMMTLVKYYVAREKKPDETLYRHSTLTKNIRFAAEVRPPSPRIEDNRNNPIADRNLEVVSHTEINWRPKGIRKLVKLGEVGGNYGIVSTRFMLKGYTFELEVTAEDEDGKPHLAVTLRLCRGRNDDNLEWPFSTPYTITLCHPHDEDYTIPVSAGFGTHTRTSYVRPQDDSNPGVCFSLIPLESFQQRQYIIDDALCLSLSLHASVQ